MNIAIIGAGLSGLMAARALVDAGHHVVVFERSRSVGGRLATRRIDGARVDHGAQFFTVRDDAFGGYVERWCAEGLVREWCRGFTAEGDGHPRYVVRDGMTSLAKHLAHDMDVRCNSLAFSLHRNPHATQPWEVKLDDGTISAHDALIVTCPLPQSFSLLTTAHVAMPEALWRTDYDRTLCLLVVLDAESAVPEPGGMQGVAPFTFVADNHAKGISDVPALTLHADPDWSAAHWDDDPADAHRELLALARPFIGDARVVTSQLKRWRFATPRSIWPEAHWSPEATPSLAVAGDAFAGPRIEGAALSGLSAAGALLS